MNKIQFNELIQTKETNYIAMKKLIDFYFSKIVLRIYRKYNNKSLGNIVANNFFAYLATAKIDEYIEYPTIWIHDVCDKIACDIKDKIFEQYAFSKLTTQLKTLDTETKHIIFMYNYEGYSFEEIAIVLKLDLDTVKEKYSHAIKICDV